MKRHMRRPHQPPNIPTHNINQHHLRQRPTPIQSLTQPPQTLKHLNQLPHPHQPRALTQHPKPTHRTLNPNTNPLHTKQRTTTTNTSSRLQLPNRHLTRHHRPHTRNQPTPLINHHQRHPIPTTHRRNTRPHRRRTPRKQLNNTPRKRQPRTTTQTTHHRPQQPMKHRIKQRRMQPKQRRVTLRLLRQRHLNKHLLPTRPHRPQPLKHRAILKPRINQTLIQPINLNHPRTHRRPLTRQHTHTLIHKPTLSHHHITGRQHPTGMTRPIRLSKHPINRRIIHPRENTHRTPTRLVHLTHHDLQLNATLRAQHQRRLQRQLHNHPTPNLPTHMQRQLHKRRPRQQHRPQHPMISQPRMRLKRQPTRKQPTPITSQPHRRTQQRMLSRHLPNRPGIPHTPRRPQPIPLTLKRIRRQHHPPSTTTSKHPTPIHRHTTNPNPRQRTQHRLNLRPLTPQQRHRHHTPIPIGVYPPHASTISV